MNHVMVDIETLGTRPGDCILSIGAVWFTADEIKSKFYVTIDSNASREAGFKAQRSTVEWWEKQNEVARTAAFRGELSPVSAFKQFGMWLPAEPVIWGNGANFDNALLSAGYRILALEQPWKFWNDRCYRTIKNLFPDVDFHRVGTYHNALDDAESQAQHLLAIVNAKGLTLN